VRAAAAGHPDVDQGHVRAMRLRDADRLLGVGRRPEQLDVLDVAEQLPERAQQSGLVVGEDHADPSHPLPVDAEDGSVRGHRGRPYPRLRTRSSTSIASLP
jgi:hypothetical protein